MDKLIDVPPAPYSRSAPKELEAITTLEFLLNPKYFKPDIQRLDKIPNSDGTIELTDEKQEVLGKVEVQVKNLRESDLKRPKFQVSKRFLSYCEDCTTPVLLIVANKKKRKAYWIHISIEMIRNLAPKIKGDSINIDFPLKNVITANSKKYHSAWVNIAKSYNLRIKDYDKIKAENEKISLEKENLKAYQSSIEIDGEICSEVHVFLDKLNNALDNRFNIIKQIFYPNIWKLGFAYSVYRKDSLTYLLYRIKNTSNTPLIRRIIDTSLLNSSEQVSLHYSTKNSIKENPDLEVRKFIEEHLKRIFLSRMILTLDHLLIREFIFHFIYKHHHLLGLEKKSVYSLAELIFGFEVFLPLWLDEFYKAEKRIGRREVNLDAIYLDEPGQAALKLQAEKTFTKGKDSLLEEGRYNIYGSATSVSYFTTFLSHLRDVRVETIANPYPQELKPTKEIYWFWERYTPRSLFNKTVTIYKNLPRVFDQMVEVHFPQLKREIRFFDRFDKLIINLNFDGKGDSRVNGPRLEFFYLASIEKGAQNSVEVYLNQPRKNLHRRYVGKTVKVKGKEYILIETLEKVINHVELPFENVLFDTLHTRFDSFIKSDRFIV